MRSYLQIDPLSSLRRSNDMIIRLVTANTGATSGAHYDPARGSPGGLWEIQQEFDETLMRGRVGNLRRLGCCDWEQRRLKWRDEWECTASR